VGRYLELDPVALKGGFNSEHGPDWYNYVDGNPLRWTDPAGKGVSRDKLWCMESVGCPKAIYCGGTKLDLTSCGTGCDRCPTLPGSVFTNDWCAYAETKSSCGGKTGALFKPAIGGLDIGWIQVCYP
jgi:hypothetical protein